MSKKKINIEKEVMRSIIHLSRRKEFYGHVVQQFEKVYVDGSHFIQTAAVGKLPHEKLIKLFIHKGYFKELFESKEEGWRFVEAAIEHEILHIVFNHLFVRFDDKVRGGVAVDCVVNGLIPDEKRYNGWVHPSQYDLEVGKSAMWYYVNLRTNEKFQSQLRGGAFGAGGQFEWVVGSHSAWESVTEDGGFLKEFVKDVVRKSKDLCNGNYGDIPGQVAQQISNILKTRKPILPWSRILRLFCASASESVLSYTMKKKSRRFGTRPGTSKGDVLNLAVVVDTSGSISDAQLVMFFNEIYHIWKNGAIVAIIEADADVERWYRYNGKWKGEVHGRGGTNLEPALKMVDRKFDAVIYFTDFYAPDVKTRYRIPTLWILSTRMPKSEYPYPWGKHVVIDDGTASGSFTSRIGNRR